MSENVNADDQQINENKTGLPEVNKFYQKFKDLKKLVQLEQDNK